MVARGASKVCKLPMIGTWFLVAFLVLLIASTLYLYSSSSPSQSPSYERFDSDKKLVYLWMQGCGWCEQFNPVWDSFVAEHGSIVTTEKLEAHDERASAYEVDGFPTVLLVSDGSDPVKFEGDRTVSGLLTFVNSHGSRESFSATDTAKPARRISGVQLRPEGTDAVMASASKFGSKAQQHEKQLKPMAQGK